MIWLVDVVEQQDITPSLTPLGLMSEKEAIDKAIALATRNQPEINASRAKLTNIKARKSTIAEAFQEILSISAIPPPVMPLPTLYGLSRWMVNGARDFLLQHMSALQKHTATSMSF